MKQVIVANLWRNGNNTNSKYSMGVCHLPHVPPAIVRTDFFDAFIKGGSNACNSNVILPAVPMSLLYVPAFTCCGRYRKDVEPISHGLVCALHICFNARIAVRCCALSPGSGRFFLMSVTSNGFCVSVESASAVLTSWPPPSPLEPSISIISSQSCRWH